MRKVTKGTGILVGTLASQAIIESSGMENGIHKVGGSGLSKRSNNYFGIKCAGGWKGEKYYIDTSEGKDICFRKYDSVEDSIRDYVKFLQENGRYEYHGVFKAKTVKEQAQALGAAGYNTSPTYPDFVLSVYNTIKDDLDASLKKHRKKITAIVIGSAMIGIIVATTAYFLTRKK